MPGSRGELIVPLRNLSIPPAAPIPCAHPNRPASPPLRVLSAPPLHHRSTPLESAAPLPTPATPADAGDSTESEVVRYLGSAMLSHAATGIGALQRPLAGLYFHTMLQTGGILSQVPRCRVTMTSKGLCIAPTREGAAAHAAAVEKKKARERGVNAAGAEAAVASRLYESAGIRYQSQLLFTEQERSKGAGFEPAWESGSKHATSQQDVSNANPKLMPNSSLDASDAVHPLAAILFWDCIQFATVRGEDKKLRFAFETLSALPTTATAAAGGLKAGGRSLFVLLDTRFHWLRTVRHQPIFACVVRRPRGVKAIDVHAFLCDSAQQARRLDSELTRQHAAQSSVTGGPENSGALFGYQPFTKDTVRSAAGQFHRRPALRKPQGSVASRSHFGSTPSLNMIFGLAPKSPIVERVENYDSGVYQSALDLYRGSDDSSSSRDSKLSSDKRFSLDSKVKAGECLRMGSELSLSEQKVMRLRDRRHGKYTASKLLQVPAWDTKRTSRMGSLGTLSSSLLDSVISETADGGLSEYRPTSSLDSSTHRNSDSRVYYLKQEDFNPKRKPSDMALRRIPDVVVQNEPVVVVSQAECLRNSDLLVNVDVAQISKVTSTITHESASITGNNSPIANTEEPITNSNSQHYDAALPLTNIVPEIVDAADVRATESVVNESYADPPQRPVALVQPQPAPRGPERIVDLNFHGPMHVIMAESPSSSTGPLSPGHRLSRIRFVYYDDAEDSLPVSKTGSHNEGIVARHAVNVDSSSAEIRYNVVNGASSNVSDAGVGQIRVHSHMPYGVQRSIPINGEQVATKLQHSHGPAPNQPSHLFSDANKAKLCEPNNLNRTTPPQNNGHSKNPRDTSRERMIASKPNIIPQNAADSRYKQKVIMNWQFKCPPPTLTADYRTLRPDEINVETETLRKENQSKAEKKNAEIATELENLTFEAGSVQRKVILHHDVNFEKTLGYFP